MNDKVIKGDDMKKYFIVVLLALLTGSLMAFFTFNSKNVNAYSKKEAYLFQIGVYKNEDNALKYARNFDSSITIKENNFYHVYTHIFVDYDLVNKVKEYYEENKINFYVKKLEIDDNLYEQLYEYQELLLNTSDIEVINKFSQNLLNIYNNYMES